MDNTSTISHQPSTMKLDILAFGAHPDDVELSCGGTILKNILHGKKIGIIDLTRGELSTRGTAALRLKESANAAKILGVLFRENLKMPDGFFQNDKNNRLTVIQKIRHYKPDVVLAGAIEDRHPDHGRAAKLIADACFLSGLVKIKTQAPQPADSPSRIAFGKPMATEGSALAEQGGGDTRNAHPEIPPLGGGGAWQQPWRPKAVYHYIQYRKLKPDFAIDISAFIEQKMEAIKAFRSQFFNPDSKEPPTLISNPDFLDYIRNREREYGKLIHVQYAEGFNVMEEYRGEILI